MESNFQVGIYVISENAPVQGRSALANSNFYDKHQLDTRLKCMFIFCMVNELQGVKNYRRIFLSNLKMTYSKLLNNSKPPESNKNE